MIAIKSNFIFGLFIFGLTSCNNPAEDIKSQLVNPSRISKAEKLFDDKCTVCHLKTTPTADQLKYIASPDIQSVVDAVYQQFYDSLQGFRKEDAIKYISHYVLQPDGTKSLIMNNPKNKFGLMPSLKGSVTIDELYLISEFILEEYNPVKPVH